MRVVLLIAVLLFSLPAKSEARIFAPAELEGLLAPVALQPDPVLWNILDAAQYPSEVQQAAEWTRQNPSLTGDAALEAVDPHPWPPSVKSLVPYSDLLARMAESPQWLLDLGSAYMGQREAVLAAVQTLRARAQASGHLQSDGIQTVQQYGTAIAVVPAIPYYYSVRYYNPLVVFGPAWRPAYHVHAWRPWVHRPVVVHRPIVHRHVVPPRRSVTVTDHQRHPRRSVAVPDRRNGAPSVAAQMQRQQAAQFRQQHRIPESKRQPIVRPWGQAPGVQHGGAHRGPRR